MIEVRDLFTETRKVVAEYRKHDEVLDKQEQELNNELVALQNEMTANLLDQEGANVSELVYLKIQLKETEHKIEIIKSLLEELAEERTASKLEFTPLYRKAIRGDSSKAGSYRATEIVERYRYLMFKEIGDLGNQMQSQYHDIAPDVDELFEDSKVKEEFPRLEYVFNRELFTPTFSWFGDSVVSKQEVFNATYGYKPVKPKHMIEENEKQNEKKEVE